MPFRAIICDIDGCLGPESHTPLDADKLALIAAHNRIACETNQNVITLCSGRPQPYAEAMCRLISNTKLPVICEMGVWLYDPRDNRFLMDPAITPRDLEVIANATRWLHTELLPQGVVIQPGKSASISLWHPSTPFLMSLKPTIESRVRSEHWNLRVSNTVAWINLELTHVSKASGIRRLMDMCNLTKPQLAGIGDTMGDMSIRENVAFFACPSNADPKLKPRADYVSTFHEVEGVLDILSRLQR